MRNTLTTIVCSLLLGMSPFLFGESINEKHGVFSAPERAQISAVIGEDNPAYHAVPQAQGFRMKNERQALSADFTAIGVDLQQEGRHWGMSLRGYGYGEKLRNTNAVAPRATANRVEYSRGPLIEWYVNGPIGVEQGFTLRHAPGSANDKPLTLAFALSGGLIASVDSGGHSLTLEKNGVAALRYSGLMASDAQGRELRSWLEIADDQLRIHVDDANAQYPLTIDPYVQATKLTTAMQCLSGGVCDDGGPSEFFGYSVAMSGDGSTAVVGGLREKAYVFLRSSLRMGGWSSFTPIYFAAKLRPSDPLGNSPFGKSVAINGNGSTIVVGDPYWQSSGFSGAAYVFVRPTNGWSSSTLLTQTAKLTAYAPQPGNQLGYSVSISGDGSVIAAGAPTTTIYRQYQGAAYVFVKPLSGWTNATETNRLCVGIQCVGQDYDFFGDSVSLSADGNTLVAGAPYMGGPGVGAAYVWTKLNGSWNGASGDARLIPSDGNQAKFGAAVSISGDGATIAVGASACEGGSCGYGPGPGAAYVYVRPGNSWWVTPGNPRTETAKLTASDGTTNDYLGISLAMAADGSVVAAAAPNTSITGSTYVFVRPLSGWASATETAKFAAADGPYSISANSDATAIIIGTPYATIGSNVQEGAAYVFTGTAKFPTAAVSPSSLAFGSRAVGTTSAPKTVTLANNGTAPLNVSGVAVTGAFTSTQNCLSASPIAPGSSCSESVSFAPPSTGAKTGTLNFTDNSGGTSGATQQVSLSGSGVKASTSTAITSVTFNPAMVGEPVIVAYSVTTGAGNSLTPAGTVAVKASTGESCSSSVPSGSCSLTFATAADRTVTATYNGNASFSASTSPGVLVHVVHFTLSASPASQTISGTSATYTVTVAAQNGFTGTVSLSCNGGPVGTTCDMSPTSVNLSGSTATSTATLTLPNGVNTGTYTITFTGQSGTTSRSTTATLTVN